MFKARRLYAMEEVKNLLPVFSFSLFLCWHTHGPHNHLLHKNCHPGFSNYAQQENATADLFWVYYGELAAADHFCVLLRTCNGRLVLCETKNLQR